MVLLTLDDRDPDIVYSNGWNHAGSALEFNKTTTWTAAAGSTARLNFQGTSIGVFGTIGQRSLKSIAPVSAYSIDGGAPVTFKAVQKPLVQTSQQFFQSPLLPDGAHTLTITNTLASDPLFLDFLMVLADADTVTPSASASLASVTANATSSSTTSTSSASSTSTSTLSTTSSLSSTTPIQSPTSTVTSFVDPSTISPSPSTSADSDTGATKSSNSAALIGGIIAGIVGMILIIFALLFWYRRYKRRNEFHDLMESNPDRFWAPVTNQSSNNTSSSVQPFILGPAPLPRPTPTPMSQTQPGASYAFDRPRYPGGYMPAEAYNSSPYANQAGPGPGPGYAPSHQSSYYGQAPAQPYSQTQAQGYPSRAYVPPSQLLNSYNG